MSIKTLSKKMLAIVAAGAMTMGLVMPTSVFAAEGDTTTEAYISKTFNTEVGKDETFSFKAEQVGGNTENVTIPDISFSATDTETTTKRAQVLFPEWTDAGKYEYTVKETAATPAITDTEHQKMIMSQAEYTMDVYVSNGDNGLEISNIIVNKTKDDKGTAATGKVDISDTDNNGFNFTNTYVQEAGTGIDPDPTKPDPTYVTDGSLNVTKTIVANGGTLDKDKEFAFTATFTFPTGTDANTLGGVKDADGNKITINEGGTYTFKLKADGNMKLTGVPVGTQISVVESATPNYKGSAESVFNGQVQTNVVAGKYNEAITVSGKLGQKQNKVDVTNTYNFVPTTGIIMNTLPYVLMIVLCGAALMAFVAFKRRRLQK
ncbi:hypothetical protein UF10_01455 [Peptostreptococcus russellii]|uniref:DUF7601 domain-containing protein n=1 Tax=Peptostreptococcus russellii TaxID=215200 RepID=A0A2P7Q296_9FIRM|nr:DUF5979 domain-containing protein [Peptostreptococcus russellii]PSJ32094.1 hypothetical protein UF10_01455 [Peptostreptococcus russellii]